ncbi:hypothetical protein PO124_25365 [Bacillus licheniformis]|nr:hypothetical protein [Bacillus licheniformis]
MQYFDFYPPLKRRCLFKLPGTVTKDSPKRILEYALGAALYVPGNRKI